MKSVVVRNLESGAEYVYTLEAIKAVVNAFEQYQRHNWAWWNYDYSQAKVSASGKTAICGDFAAIIV